MSKESESIKRINEVLDDVGYSNLISCEEHCKLEGDSELFLFVSFDIFNSTKLKYSNHEWFEIIKVLLNETFNGTRFWKFNGDEIIFYYPINNLLYMIQIIESCYEKLFQLRTDFEKINKNILIKGTIWLARANNALEDDYNKKIKLDDYYEFVGRNIDEGFRLTKHSSVQRIVVDPKIVYLLLEALDVLNHRNITYTDNFSKSILNDSSEGEIRQLKRTVDSIHFIGCTRCKGVWGDNPYPIFWFYKDSDNSQNDHYNEYFDGVHIWDKRFDKITENDYRSKIGQIFEIVNEEDEFQRIKQLLSMHGTVKKPFDKKPNLYYMVACYSPNSGKVLIGKRSPKRNHLRNVWDFGNVKYQNTNVIGTIKQDYLNVFGIDISLELDAHRGYNIKPFGYCTIYRNCKPHNCLLCFAKINESGLSDEQILDKIRKTILSKDLYTEVNFVSANDVEDLKPLTLDEIREDSELATNAKDSKIGENRCIMYFKESIKEAQAYFKHH